ncbi:hypothetical protein LTR94_014916 [Friedmanniomyces endolithicus]|nr:hypothetical protein LTR94_014916 [Friedmanniomyces endolithicus]
MIWARAMWWARSASISPISTGSGWCGRHEAQPDPAHRPGDLPHRFRLGAADRPVEAPLCRLSRCRGSHRRFHRALAADQRDPALGATVHLHHRRPWPGRRRADEPGPWATGGGDGDEPADGAGLAPASAAPRVERREGRAGAGDDRRVRIGQVDAGGAAGRARLASDGRRVCAARSRQLRDSALSPAGVAQEQGDRGDRGRGAGCAYGAAAGRDGQGRHPPYGAARRCCGADGRGRDAGAAAVPPLRFGAGGTAGGAGGGVHAPDPGIDQLCGARRTGVRRADALRGAGAGAGDRLPLGRGGDRHGRPAVERNRMSAALLVMALRDPATTAALDAAGWNSLIAMARAERLIGTLAFRLDGQAVPEAVRPILADAREDAAREARQAIWEADRARAALAPIGLPVILLKGTAYAAAGLPAGRGRFIGDLDILVPRDRIDAAADALIAAGWEWVKEDPYDDAYYRRWMHELPPMIHTERDRMIDVHHTVLPLTARPTPDAAAMMADAVLITDGLYMLSAEDRALEARAARHGIAPHVRQAQRLAAAIYGAGARLTLWDRLVRARLLARNGWGQETRKLLVFAFFVRSHWLRMPPLMLARHLLTKWRKGHRPQ